MKHVTVTGCNSNACNIETVTLLHVTCYTVTCYCTYMLLVGTYMMLLLPCYSCIVYSTCIPVTHDPCTASSSAAAHALKGWWWWCCCCCRCRWRFICPFPVGTVCDLRCCCCQHLDVGMFPLRSLVSFLSGLLSFRVVEGLFRPLSYSCWDFPSARAVLAIMTYPSLWLKSSLLLVAAVPAGALVLVFLTFLLRRQLLFMHMCANEMRSVRSEKALPPHPPAARRRTQFFGPFFRVDFSSCFAVRSLTDRPHMPWHG